MGGGGERDIGVIKRDIILGLNRVIWGLGFRVWGLGKPQVPFTVATSPWQIWSSEQGQVKSDVRDSGLRICEDLAAC